MKATIFFHGDESVGDRSYYYEMEIPKQDFITVEEKIWKEQLREKIKLLYAEMDGEYTPIVIFEDETLFE